MHVYNNHSLIIASKDGKGGSEHLRDQQRHQGSEPSRHRSLTIQSLNNAESVFLYSREEESRLEQDAPWKAE